MLHIFTTLCNNVGVHVEYESSKWITSFNLYFGLCTIFDYLLNWLEEADSAVVVNKVWTVAELLGPCPRHGDQDSNDQTTPISLLNNTTGDATDEGHEYGGGNGTHLPLLSCMDLMDLLVTKARLWLINNCNERSSTVFPIIASRSSAATCSTDKTMSLPSFPVAFSFHILLPRFIACLIRECCKQSHLLDSLDHLSHHLQSATVLRGAVDVPQVCVHSYHKYLWRTVIVLYLYSYLYYIEIFRIVGTVLEERSVALLGERAHRHPVHGITDQKWLVGIQRELHAGSVAQLRRTSLLHSVYGFRYSDGAVLYGWFD